MKKGKFKVVVVMGSRSDLSIMKEASQALKEFEIESHTTILSAHRTPERLEKDVSEWESAGVQVIIAGAGGAAHLPGMLASFSVLPVIGVPVTTRSLNGLDSLLSIAQMPKGVPVATVAIQGAYNAGVLAAKILSLQDKRVSKKIRKQKMLMSKNVHRDRRKLDQLGIKNFLAL